MTSEKRKEAQRLASAKYRASNRETVNAKCRQRAAEKRAAYASNPDQNEAIGAELQARREASARYYAKNADRIRARSRERLRNQRAKANLTRLEQVQSWAESVKSKGSDTGSVGSPSGAGYPDWDSELDSTVFSSSDDGGSSARSPYSHSRSLSIPSSLSGGRELSPSVVSSRSSHSPSVTFSPWPSGAHHRHPSGSDVHYQPRSEAYTNPSNYYLKDTRPSHSFHPQQVPRSMQHPTPVPGELQRNYSFPPPSQMGTGPSLPSHLPHDPSLHHPQPRSLGPAVMMPHGGQPYASTPTVPHPGYPHHSAQVIQPRSRTSHLVPTRRDKKQLFAD